MQKEPKISEAEWEVMSALWDEARATSGILVERLTQSSDWQPKTIKTLLGRLVKKGFVTFDQDGSRYLYRPAIQRHEVIRQESRSFLDRVFRGDGASLLAHFAEEVDLTDDEARSLRTLLDKASEKSSAAPGERS